MREQTVCDMIDTSATTPHKHWYSVDSDVSVPRGEQRPSALAKNCQFFTIVQLGPLGAAIVIATRLYSSASSCLQRV